ncbi:MAG TPA: hypothetical protein VGM37_05025 [Armatimonadota bacterium]|jgi:hypothetical protein
MKLVHLTLWGIGAALIVALAVCVVVPRLRRFRALDKAGRNEFWSLLSIVAVFALWSAAIWMGLRFAEYYAVRFCAPMVVIPVSVDLRRWRQREVAGRRTLALIALRACAFALLIAMAFQDLHGNWRTLALGELGGYVLATAVISYVEGLVRRADGASPQPGAAQSPAL